MQTVVSKDGTKIAYDKSGKGRAVILIGGALMTRESWADLPKLLAGNFTVYAYDRRGRGDSGDTLPYALDRELEDIDALVTVAGESASLYGISSGGALALEAAIKLDGKTEKLAVYEVPYDSSIGGLNAWREFRAKLKEALDRQDRSEAIVQFLKFVGQPDESIENMKKMPMWQALEALAPTLAYDVEAIGKDRMISAEQLEKMTAPALILDGGASLEHAPFMRTTANALAKGIMRAKHTVIEGQGHDVDAKAIAPVLTEFFLN